MRWLTVLMCWGLVFGSTAHAAEGRVLKVLPQFLDKKGQSAISPSLYDRDAYQAMLRRNPARRSALRFAVQWKAGTPATQPLKMRVELRGMARADLPKETALELPVTQHGWFSHWAYLTLAEEDYQKFGEVTAWRVTLWDGDHMLAEQKSFLW